MARQAPRLIPLDRRILALSLPALATLAADPLLSLADTAFVARLGTVPLAALGVNAALFSFAFFAFNFLAYATTPMVASRLAGGDQAGAGRVVVQALYLAVALGVTTTVSLVVGAELLVAVMQAAPEVAGPAVSYLRIRAFAAPALLVVTAAHGAFRGLGDTRTPLGITIAVNLINVVLDPLLIFAVGLGLEGAALATVAAQWIGAAWFLRLLGRVGRSQGWRWHRPPLRELAPMLGAGGVLTLRTLFLTATLAAAAATAAWHGPAELAAHQVVAQVWFLLTMIVDAIAISAQVLVADRVGRGDKEEVRRVATRLGWWGLLTGVVLGAGLYLARGALAAAFATEPAVAALIVSATTVAALLQPAAALLFVADGVYLGLLQMRLLAVSTAVGLFAGVALLLATVAGGWGLVGVWWALGAMVVARLAVLVFSYRGVGGDA